MRQDLPADEVEVIVVDNGSTDATLSIAQSFPVKVVVEAKRGRSRARNLGARLARGQYLAFIDVDCEAPPDWLSASLGALDKPWIGAVQARVHKPGFAAPPREFVQAHYYRPFMDTCAMVTTRDAFEHAHGFDEELRRTVDMDYSFRLLSCGYAFAWLPDVVMIKHHELTPRQILRRGWDGGKSLSVLARKWRKLTPQSPARLWRDRSWSLLRSVVGDARHPLRSGGRNALEATLKFAGAAVTDLQGGEVRVERYELATRLPEVLGTYSSLVVSAQAGWLFDAAGQRCHPLDRAQMRVLSGLIDGLEGAALLRELTLESGMDDERARRAVAAARELTDRLRRAS